MDKRDAKNRIEKLRELINYHRDLYCIKVWGFPLIFFNFFKDNFCIMEKYEIQSIREEIKNLNEKIKKMIGEKVTSLTNEGLQFLKKIESIGYMVEVDSDGTIISITEKSKIKIIKNTDPKQPTIVDTSPKQEEIDPKEVMEELGSEIITDPEEIRRYKNIKNSLFYGKK